MAPANDYLTDDESAVKRLAAHNRHLVKRTTIEFEGEDPEVHWDFHRPAEIGALSEFLARFSETDFVDGNVTLQGATEHVYGEPDEYLMKRTYLMLKPASAFNKAHTNGLVYVVNSNGTVGREDRESAARRELETQLDHTLVRVVTVAHREADKVGVALRRALKIDPNARAALEARSSERQGEIGVAAQLELGPLQA